MLSTKALSLRQRKLQFKNKSVIKFVKDILMVS